MNRLFYKVAKFSKSIPLNWLVALTRQNLIHSFYHTVSDSDLPHIKHLYKIRDTKTFEEDLDFLLSKFEPLSIEDYMAALKENRSFKKPSFVLSFDDGLSEFYDIAADILLRKGVPAICFINSGFIDNQDLFYRYKVSLLIDVLSQKQLSLGETKELKKWFSMRHLTFDNYRGSLLSLKYDQRSELDSIADILELSFESFLKEQKPYMTSAQLIELKKKGFSFGAHSIDHPRFSEIDLNEQVRQVKVCLDDIEKLLSPKDRIFSFPFTDNRVGAAFFDAVLSGESPIADFTFGCAGIKHDSAKLNIQRIPIEVANHSAQDVIYGELLYYMAKSFLNKNIIKRR